MKKNISFIIIQACLLCFCIFPVFVNSQAYCEVKLQSLTYQINAVTEENYDLPLTQFVSGYNLTYTLNANLEPALTLIQPVNQLDDEILSQNITRSVSIWSAPNSQSTIALLQQNSLNGNYFVQFAFVHNDQTIDVSNSSEIAGPYNITCLGITMLTEFIASIDCLVLLPGNQNSTWQYLASSVSTNQVNPITQQEINEQFQERKSLTYIYNNDSFLLNYVPFYSYIDQNQENYISVYRYDWQDDQQSFIQPYGTLNELIPITAEDLGMTSPLKIVQIQIIGSYIFLLDNSQGVFCFQYISNQVINLLRFASPSFQNWGMAVNNIGGQINLLLASQNYIYQYIWQIYKDKPILIQKYEAPFTSIQSTASMNLNSDYIFAQVNNTLSIYKQGSYNKGEIFSSFLSIDFYMTLPTNQLVILKNQSIMLNQLAIPSLSISAIDFAIQKDFLLQAQSQFNDKQFFCIQKFTLQITNSDQWNPIYSTGLNIPSNYDLVGDWSVSLPLGITYIGPNLNYSAQIQSNYSNQNIEEKINNQDTNQDYIFINDIPNLASLNFSFGGIPLQFIKVTKIFPLSETEYYALHQNIYGNVYIYMCRFLDKQIFTATCGPNPISFVPLNGLISIYSQGYWYDQPFWSCVINKQNNTIVAYYFNGTQIYNISVSNNAGIMDFKIGLKQIYVLTKNNLSNNPLIEVFQLQKGILNWGSLNIQQVSQFPNQQNFNPINLHISQDYANILFIESPSYLLVVELFDYNFVFLSNIVFSPPPHYNNRQVEVGKGALIVAYDGPQGLIQEYSLQDLQNVIESKTYPMFDYSIFTNLTCSFSWGTQLLYILMTRNNDMQAAIIVYRLNTQYVNTLYQIIPINLQGQQIQPGPYLTANGDKVDFVYLFFNNQNIIFCRSAKNPSVYVIPQYNYISSYVEKLNVTIQVIPFYELSNQTNSIEIQLTMINSQTKVTLNQSYFNSQSSQQLLMVPINSVFPYQFIIDDYPWFYGTVVQYNLACNECNSTIQLTNHVTMNLTNIKIVSNPSDLFVDIIADDVYVLSNEVLYILDQSLSVVNTPIFLNVPQNNHCSRLVENYQGNKLFMMFVVCYDSQQQNYYLIPINLSSANPFPGKSIYLPQINNLGDTAYKDGVFIALNLGTSAQQSEQGTNGIIYMYKLNFTSPQSTTLIQQLDDETLNIVDLNITSFDIQDTDSTNVVKLFLTDNYINICIVDLNVSDYTKFNSTPFNIQNLIQSQNLYLPSKERLIKIVMLDQSHVVNLTLTYSMLIVTRQVALYELELVFSATEPDVRPLIYSSSQITKVYSNYGINLPSSRISYNQQTKYQLFSISYFNQQTNISTLAIYNRTKPSEFEPSQQVPLTDMIGGLEFKNSMANTFCSIFVLDSQLNIKLLSANPASNGVSILNYNNDLILNIQQKDFTTKSITFIPISDYAQGINASFPLGFQPYPNPSPSSSSSIPGPGGDDDGLAWYWIMLIAIGGVIVISVLVFFILKYFRKGKSGINHIAVNEEPKSTTDYENYEHISMQPQQQQVNN